MRRILSCTVAGLLCMPLLAQVDPVVMTVNGYDVTQSEFEYFFEKNNIETNVTKKTVRQYADLYLNFKLKVQAAIDEGLDKSESFISEYKMCRDMQAEDYVIDNDFLEDVARSSYEQSLLEIGDPGLMHIYVMSSTPDENEGRTLDDSFEKMKSVHEQLQAGGSFQALARQYSEDNLARNGGEAGWLSLSQMPDDVAEVIMSLEVGQYSKPFVSNGTAFIVMLEGRRYLGSYEENRDDIYDWMRESGVFDQAKQRKANEYATRLGWAERDDAAVARLDSTLEEVEPDFRNISREYYDGLLVFDISNREIWERESNHPEEMEAYFESHRKQFNFDKPCFKGMVLFCQKEEDFNELKEILDKQDMSEWVNSILAFNSSSIRVRVLRSSSENDIFKQGQNQYVDKIVFGQGEYKPMNGFPYVNVLGKTLKKPETISDVAGEVSEEYQKYLENEWMKRLKSKYKYKIDKKALKKVNVR